MRTWWLLPVLLWFACPFWRDKPAQAQTPRVLAFMVSRALPAGRSFTFGVITGVAGNAAYDALKNAFSSAAAQPVKPTPPPTPQPTPVPPVVPPRNSSGIDLNVILNNPCAFGSCASLHKKLFDLDESWQRSVTSATPAPPVINQPPPPPACSEGMEPRAALERAVKFDNGTLTLRRDPVAALTCYYVGARQDVPIAEYDLADMLLIGDEGVGVDLATGLDWLEEAALGGFVPAQTRLAVDYQAGSEGAPTDMNRAAEWYVQAARGGDAYAQYQMAQFAWDGLGGLKKDPALAFEWLDLALYQGFPDSQQTMDQLLNELQKDERMEYRGAYFAFGLAFEWGVPGRIQINLEAAMDRYQRAYNMGYIGASEALSRVCSKAPSLCS